jgi:hypothetical protein
MNDKIKSKEKALSFIKELSDKNADAKAYEEFYKILSYEIKNDYDVCQKMVVARQSLIEIIPINLQTDHQFLFESIQKNPYIFIKLKMIDKRFKTDFCNDKELIELVITKVPQTLKLVTNPELLNDKDLIALSVSKYGETLKYASESLKNNYSIVKKAVDQDIHAVCFAGSHFRNNPEKLFKMNPIKFLTRTHTGSFKYSENFRFIQGNLKGRNTLENARFLEKFLLKPNNWKDLLKNIDKINGNNEAYQNVMEYLPLMMKHWKGETIKKLLKEMDNKDLILSNDFHFGYKFIPDMKKVFYKELETRSFKQEIEKVDSQRKTLIKNRKLAI